jgi:hypothetical protein
MTGWNIWRKEHGRTNLQSGKVFHGGQICIYIQASHRRAHFQCRIFATVRNATDPPGTAQAANRALIANLESMRLAHERCLPAVDFIQRLVINIYPIRRIACRPQDHNSR